MSEVCVERKEINAIVPTVLILPNLTYLSRSQRLYSGDSTCRKDCFDIDNCA